MIRRVSSYPKSRRSQERAKGAEARSEAKRKARAQVVTKIRSCSEFMGYDDNNLDYTYETLSLIHQKPIQSQLLLLIV